MMHGTTNIKKFVVLLKHGIFTWQENQIATKAICQ